MQQELEDGVEVAEVGEGWMGLKGRGAYLLFWWAGREQESMFDA